MPPFSHEYILNHLYLTVVNAEMNQDYLSSIPFERMEDNQLSAMDAIAERAGGRGWFALGYPGEKIYMVEKFKLCMLRDSGAKALGNNLPDSLRIEVWLREHSDQQ